MEKDAFIYEVITSVLIKSPQLIKCFQITNSLCSYLSLAYTYTHTLKQISIKHASILLACLTSQHGM